MLERRGESGRVYQANVMPGKRNRNIVSSEALENGLVQFDLGRFKMRDLYPGLYGYRHGRVGEAGDTGHRCRFPQHMRMAGQDILNGPQRVIDIGIVGDADGEIELADTAEVVKNLADDLAVRDHNS